MASSSERKTYVVFRGRNPGMYNNWPDCKEQTNRFSYSYHKAFGDRSQAEEEYFKFCQYVVIHVKPVYECLCCRLTLVEKRQGSKPKYYACPTTGNFYVWAHELKMCYCKRAPCKVKVIEGGRRMHYCPYEDDSCGFQGFIDGDKSVGSSSVEDSSCCERCLHLENEVQRLTKERDQAQELCRAYQDMLGFEKLNFDDES